MTKTVFLSFHYRLDAMRVQLVKQMGALTGQELMPSNKWESVKAGGADGIRRYIAREMAGKDALVVLIGTETASRPWVQYEIKKAWESGLGVLGVHIHGLPDPKTGTCRMGPNPFTKVPISPGSTVSLSSVVRAYNPTGPSIYKAIESNIPALIDEAIAIRKKY